MKEKINFLNALKLLLALSLLNYMFVTIIFRNTIFLRLLRDLVLIFMVISIILKKKKDDWKLEKFDITYFIFIALLFMSFFRSESLGTGFVVVRRYLLPLIVLFICRNMNISKNDFFSLAKFIIILLGILSIWGIFQALILKDDFLMNLGYPTVYSYGYKKTMLYSSYYFGNLGIQRVVSTLSNSNIFGLILGITIVYYLPLYNKLKKEKHLCLFAFFIVVAYLLTFSRSNFLAMLIVLICGLWKEIPRRIILYCISFISITLIILALLSPSVRVALTGIAGWVINSLTGKESSANGRSAIWLEAFQTVKHNPFGISLGKVGSIAREAGVEKYFHAENSYLSLALDTGWMGLVAYISSLILIAQKILSFLKKCVNNSMLFKINKSGLFVLLYLIIVMFFSNHIYDMEAMIFVYAYIGITLSANYNFGSESIKNRLL